MPYLKSKNLLFIHIPKCAGKSFEVAMGIIEERESKKYKWRSTLNGASKYLLSRTKDEMSKPRLWGTYDISFALQHLTYVEIEVLGLLENEVLEKSIKVAIVRNPYDRAVSSFHHMGKDYSSFLDFVRNYYASENRDHNDLAHKKSQIDFIRNKKGEIIIDNLIRFETLSEDFEQFKEEYNLEGSRLPHIGNQIRGKKSYKDFYCEESKRIVSNLFDEDLNLLEYNF